jgi:ribosomal protein S18 acetylase RimI-like enzyme
MTFPTPTPALPEEQEQAFRLLLSHLPPDRLLRRLASSMDMFKRGEIDPQGLLVFRRDGEVIGAIAANVIPGGTGIVWPPSCQDQGGQDALIREALSWMAGRGARLVQALLHPDEVHLAAPLLRNGFQHVTGLWYLGHDREMSLDRLGEEPRLSFESFDRTDHDVFRETMARSFEGSLDCPEVTGARSIEEVMTGFQGQGVFDPGAWWLASDGDNPVGVLLTSAIPDEDAWEISYVGVVPEARRRGYGREIVTRALFEARAVDVGQVFLTVDARNEPAWKLYRSLGFEPFDRREVFLMLRPQRL